jgi:hypothetical protein
MEVGTDVVIYFMELRYVVMSLRSFIDVYPMETVNLTTADFNKDVLY